MKCVLETALEQQRTLELEMMGLGVNPNPIIDRLEESLNDSLAAFSRPPIWAKRLQLIGVRVVAHIALCAVMDKVSKEGDTAQAHPVVNEISQRLTWHAPDLDRDARLAMAWNLVHVCRSAGYVDLYQSKREDTTVVRLSKSLKEALTEFDLWGMAGLTRRPMLIQPVPHTIDAPGGYLTDPLRHGISHGSWDNVTENADKLVRVMNAKQNVGWRIHERSLELAEFLAVEHEFELNTYSHKVALVVAREMVGRTFWLVVYLDHRGRVYYYCDILSPQGNDLCAGLLRFEEGQVMSTDEDWYWAKVHVANCCSGLPIADGLKLDKMGFDARVQWVDDNMENISAVSDDPIQYKHLWWDGFGKGAMSFKCFAACDALAEALDTGEWNLPVRLDATSSNNQHTAMMLRDSDLAWRVNVIPNDTGEPHNFRDDVCEENHRAWVEGERDHEYVDLFLDNEETVNNSSVAKNPTMIIPYGGSVLNIGRKFMGDKTWHNAGTDDEPEWMVIASPDSPIGKLDISVDLGFGVSMKLGSDYRKSLLTVAPGILEYMTCIRACIKSAGEDGEAMSWLTAMGLRVVNMKRVRVEATLTASTCFDDETCSSLKFWKYEDTLDVRKACTAGPPNFTHSMDACHLQLCIWDLVENCGVISIAGIHDCLAALPKDIPAMRRTVPKMLVAMYRTSPLEIVCEDYDVELPEFGDLDLDDVLRSRYIFM